MLHVEIVDDRRRFAALRREWSELLASSRADCLFLTWEWMYTWWTHLSEGRQLFLVTVRRDSKLIALAPLAINKVFRSMRMCEFLGVGSVGSDYLDFIVDAAFESEAVSALVECLAETGLSLRLPSVKEDSLVATAFAEKICDQRWRLRKVAMPVCPFIDLTSASWDSYIGTRGSSHRYNFKRRLRNLEKSYAVRFERAESDDECRAALQNVIALHLSRWSNRGGSDGFHQERLLAFHQELITLAREEGWLRLRVLTLNGHPAGAFYGFRYRGKYIFYQSGFDESFLRQSVGLVTIGLTIREAIEEGAAEYDFLHGAESYKFLWAGEVRPLSRMEFYPPGVAGRIHLKGVGAVSATKKIVKRALHAPVNR